MLNLNLNTISSTDIGNPSLGPNSSKLTYDYSSSVWDGANEVEQQLTITISGSDEISRNPWERQFIASGSEAQNKTYTLQSGSSINVKLEAATPFDTNPETFVKLEYIVAGGGNSGQGNGNVGGTGGNGGKILTGSVELPFSNSSVTASVNIGAGGTILNEVVFNTASIIDYTFTDTGNEDYIVSASIEVNQFTDYFSSASLIGSGGVWLGTITNAGDVAGNQAQQPGQNTIVNITNMGNQGQTLTLNTETGITYGNGAVAPSTGAISGGVGLLWLNNVVYGSGGGHGQSSNKLNQPSAGGPGAGAGGPITPRDGVSNRAGGGGGAGYGGTATPGTEVRRAGNGGSGVFIVRFFDPNNLYTSSGGVKTKIGDYVYHQFNTSGVFNFTIPATNPYI